MKIIFSFKEYDQNTFNKFIKMAQQLFVQTYFSVNFFINFTSDISLEENNRLDLMNIDLVYNKSIINEKLISEFSVDDKIY